MRVSGVSGEGDGSRAKPWEVSVLRCGRLVWDDMRHSVLTLVGVVTVCGEPPAFSSPLKAAVKGGEVRKWITSVQRGPRPGLALQELTRVTSGTHLGPFVVLTTMFFSSAEHFPKQTRAQTCSVCAVRGLELGHS